MSDGAAAGEYRHPVPAAVEAVETALAECVGAPLWSVSGQELDDLVPRAYALLGRVMGSVVLPLVREVDRRGLAGEMDAPNTAAWLRWLLRVTPSQARKLVEVAQAVDGGGPFRHRCGVGAGADQHRTRAGDHPGGGRPAR